MRRKILIYIPLKLKYSITIFKAYDTFIGVFFLAVFKLQFQSRTDGW